MAASVEASCRYFDQNHDRVTRIGQAGLPPTSMPLAKGAARAVGIVVA